jgi:hypothetical protein
MRVLIHPSFLGDSEVTKYYIRKTSSGKMELIIIHSYYGTNRARSNNDVYN